MDRRRAADGEGRTQRGRHRRGRRGVVQPADDDRRLGLGSRQQLERRFEDQAERAVRAAIDFDQVEPGDVLHYATAREDDLSAPVHQPQAEQAVADRARADPPRSGERRRHEAADGRFPGGPIERARIHRLERQDLIVRGERGFDRRERSSRSRAQHHFGRFVKHDPLQSRRRKPQGAFGRTAQARTRSAAHDVERAASTSAHDFRRLGFVGGSERVEGHAAPPFASGPAS